jgi:hypothetical protein
MVLQGARSPSEAWDGCSASDEMCPAAGGASSLALEWEQVTSRRIMEKSKCYVESHEDGHEGPV